MAIWKTGKSQSISYWPHISSSRWNSFDYNYVYWEAGPCLSLNSYGFQSHSDQPQCRRLKSIANHITGLHTRSASVNIITALVMGKASLDKCYWLSCQNFRQSELREMCIGQKCIQSGHTGQLWFPDVPVGKPHPPFILELSVGHNVG